MKVVLGDRQEMCTLLSVLKVIGTLFWVRQEIWTL